ncbi:IGHMBP2 family helicase [uncultured Methanobrevibacter sp.]|uniref:IGHMBP2 family helicase n=1 Tax=uncultured Methanobrevibacter sp. TaxID=253161 RepID=UPI0025D7783E|nr:IGHMBP2 family helicase [uncultured Methanobrevibacter sp.]
MVENYKKHLEELILSELDSEKELVLEKLQTNNLEELEKEGKAISNLKRKIIRYYRDDCTVELSSSTKIDVEIKVGDIVLISGSLGIAKNLTGIVKKINYNSIVVKFVNKTIKEKIYDNCRVDLYIKMTTYDRQINNLRNPACNEILNLLLGSVPKVDNSIGGIRFFDRQLNKFQKRAVINGLKCGSFFLIHGPFGTGKTKTLVELIKQEVALNHKVLVTVETNIAVDNLAENLIGSKINMTRIGTFEKFSTKMKEFSLEVKSKSHKSYVEIKKLEQKKEKMETELKVSSKKDKQSLVNKINNLNNEISRIKQTIYNEIVGESKVIFATNSSAALNIISEIHFDMAIVDEAAQTTIPSVLIPICKAERFILAGDHMQLPPTVKSNDDELKISLFEKLIRIFPQQSQLLKKQYRMNKFLMDFPNKEFYNNELICDKSVRNIKLNLIDSRYDNGKPLIFLDTSSAKINQESTLMHSKSYINDLEAKIAVNLVNDYLKSNLEINDIGIITNYSDQVNLIKKMTPVEVATVDGFQGREKEVIIISTVRSNDYGGIGFLDEPRRLNVALTRAKRKLIIIGNSKTLCQKRIYERLYGFCKENASVMLY